MKDQTSGMKDQIKHEWVCTECEEETTIVIEGVGDPYGDDYDCKILNGTCKCGADLIDQMSDQACAYHEHVIENPDLYDWRSPDCK